MEDKVVFHGGRREWADIPEDLLFLISDRLGDHRIGSLRFSSVCSAWRHRHSIPPPPFPPRLFHRSRGGLYLSKRTVFALAPPSCSFASDSDDSPPPSRLIKLEDEDSLGKMRLCNPLTGEYVLKPLPSIFPRKINLLELNVVELGHEYVLWSYDASFDLPTESIHRDKLAVCSPGKDNRHFVVLALEFPSRFLSVYRALEAGGMHDRVAYGATRRFSDLITFQGMFYIMDSSGTTQVIQPESMKVTTTLASRREFCGDTKRLGQCEADLLLVDICTTKQQRYGLDRRIQIKLFKLHQNRQSWVETNGIGDQILFLGEKSSFSISAASTSGCKGNRIVFECWLDSQVNLNSTVGNDDVLGFGFFKVFDVATGEVQDLAAVPDLTELFTSCPYRMSTQ